MSLGPLWGFFFHILVRFISSAEIWYCLLTSNLAPHSLSRNSRGDWIVLKSQIWVLSCQSRTLLSAGHSMCYSISRQVAATAAGGAFPQQVNTATDEIYLHAPKGFSWRCIPTRLYSHGCQPAENCARFTPCTKICYKQKPSALRTCHH